MKSGKDEEAFEWKKLVLGIDIKEKQVLGIKKRHKTSFGDQGKGKPSIDPQN